MRTKQTIWIYLLSLIQAFVRLYVTFERISDFHDIVNAEDDCIEKVSQLTHHVDKTGAIAKLAKWLRRLGIGVGRMSVVVD